MYLPYVYYIRNKITNQYYIGLRTAHVKKNVSPEEDLWNYYFTSSKYVKQLIEEYGKGSFDTVILYRFSDHDVCYWYEQTLIKEHIDNPLCINKHYADPDSGMKTFLRTGIAMTDTAKQKLRDCNLGKKLSDKTLAKRKQSILNKTPDKKLLTSERLSSAAKNRPPISDETRAKLRGRRGITPACTLAALAREAKKKLNGFEVSTATRNKLSAAMQGRKQELVRCPYCKKSGGNSMKRWHFDNCSSRLS